MNNHLTKLKKVLAGMAVFTIWISCTEDFLEVTPVGALSENALSNKEGIYHVLTGAYGDLNGYTIPYGFSCSPVQIAPCQLRGGEAHKGYLLNDLQDVVEFSKHSISTTNLELNYILELHFDGINRCNQVLHLLNSAEDMTLDERVQVEAEAKFLRGHYYFNLWRNFKNVPWIDENVEDVRVTNVDNQGNYIDISEHIAADFDFARQHLPETYGPSDIGRPNKWAADAYYARCLIYAGNYTGQDEKYVMAKSILEDIMANGVASSGEKYGLQEHYQWNFNPDHENSKESVFAVQCSVNDGTTFADGTCNITVAFFLNPGLVMGSGQGAMQPTQWYVDHFRTTQEGLPYLDQYETNPASIKSDDGILSTQPYERDSINPVDPRLDWCVGRRGIPFLDWGINPGSSWIQSQATFGPYLQKKWVIYRSQVDEHTSTGPLKATDQNMDIIRFAEILLLAAELEARIGDTDMSRQYVNKVRARMADHPENWVKMANGTHAANYVIAEYPPEHEAFSTREMALDAVLFERTLELGLEGHRMYDLVRFGKDETEINSYLAFESELREYLAGSSYEPYEAYLPFSSKAIINSQKDGQPTLKQNPGYY